MKLLFLKTLRAMWHNKKAYLACIIVIMIGIMMFTAMSNLLVNLESTVNAYYRDYRLADIFAELSGMPKNRISVLESIEGIAEVYGRYILDARVLMPDYDNVCKLRLIGVQTAEKSTLNGYITEGSDIAAGSNDILVGSGFIAAHTLNYGDYLDVIVSGKIHRLRLCGTAMSPEYVYAIPDIGTLYPDTATFDIAYVDAAMLDLLTNNGGFVNHISFLLQPGYAFEDVRDDISAELEKSGLLRLYPQKDQLSFQVMDSELSELSAMATIIPILFLLIAAIILYIMLRRLVVQERTILGTLKAFGFSNSQILLHYIHYGLLTGIIGGIFGAIIGMFLSNYLYEMYMTFFNIPDLVSTISIEYFFSGA